MRSETVGGVGYFSRNFFWTYLNFKIEKKFKFLNDLVKKLSKYFYTTFQKNFKNFLAVNYLKKLKEIYCCFACDFNTQNTLENALSYSKTFLLIFPSFYSFFLVFLLLYSFSIWKGQKNMLYVSNNSFFLECIVRKKTETETETFFLLVLCFIIYHIFLVYILLFYSRILTVFTSVGVNKKECT